MNGWNLGHDYVHIIYLLNDDNDITYIMAFRYSKSVYEYIWAADIPGPIRIHGSPLVGNLRVPGCVHIGILVSSYAAVSAVELLCPKTEKG